MAISSAEKRVNNASSVMAKLNTPLASVNTFFAKPSKETSALTTGCPLLSNTFPCHSAASLQKADVESAQVSANAILFFFCVVNIMTIIVCCSECWF